MGRRKDFHKIIIGRSEELSMVDTGMLKVPAKVDTGAYRSAIHADNIRVSKDGALHFRLLGGHPICGKMAEDLTVTKFNKTIVANSFGHREQRYEVRLRVKLGPKIFTAPFTLADRSKKIYPILLGRILMSGRFLVDTEKTGTDRTELKEKYGIVFPKDEEEGR